MAVTIDTQLCLCPYTLDTVVCTVTLQIQWNSSNPDTNGTEYSVHISEVS